MAAGATPTTDFSGCECNSYDILPGCECNSGDTLSGCECNSGDTLSGCECNSFDTLSGCETQSVGGLSEALSGGFKARRMERGEERERWDDARPAGSSMWVPPTRPADHPLAGGTRGEADGAGMERAKLVVPLRVLPPAPLGAAGASWRSGELVGAAAEREARQQQLHGKEGGGLQCGGGGSSSCQQQRLLSEGSMGLREGTNFRSVFTFISAGGAAAGGTREAGQSAEEGAAGVTSAYFQKGGPKRWFPPHRGAWV
ncbi:unnamed protein product [Closterium sp. NIES-65]|nr:unnamed protein product [Closterium sp. NIES-65]